VTGTGRLLLSLAMVAATTWSAVQGQSRDTIGAQASAGSISGTVMTDGAQPQPVRRAVLILGGGSLTPPRSVLSDDQGRFTLVGLPEGNYSLAAVKPGFVSATYGEKQPGRGPGVVVSLLAGQRHDGLVIRLVRGGVITGRVFDDGGRPFPGSPVTLMESRIVNGERRFVTPPVGPGAVLEPRAVTDDRGIYRIYGLPPGEYIVSSVVPAAGGGAGPSADLRRVTATELQWAAAQVQGAAAAGRPTAGPPAAASPPLGPRVGSAPVYFPGTPDPAAAVPVRVASGEERAGVDFAVSFVPTARVEGTVAGPDAQPVAGAQLLLTRNGPAMPSPVMAGVTSQDNGSFSIASVPPGTYQLVARTRGAPISARGAGAASAAPAFLWAMQDITVSGEDINGLSIGLQPGLRMTGRVTFEGSSGNAVLAETSARARISLATVPGGPANASAAQIPRINSDGTFEIAGLMPGRYRLSAVVPPGADKSTWTLRSSILGTRDLADGVVDITSADLTGVVVTFTDRTTGIAGRLLDTLGRPAPDFFVVVFSSDRQHWQEGARRLPPPVRPATDGTYRVVPLPAGTYYVAALTDLVAEERYDAAFLEQVAAGALTITVGEGELRQQDLRLAGP
jgi:hypothetical protein